MMKTETSAPAGRDLLTTELYDAADEMVRLMLEGAPPDVVRAAMDHFLAIRRITDRMFDGAELSRDLH